MLGVLASVWGASYLFIKLGLEDLSPAGVVFARTALAALVLLPLALRRRALHGLRGRVAAVGLLAAVQVAGPFLLISAGELEISSALAGILVATAPIFTALLAPWLDEEERSGGSRLVGVVVGMLGVALLLGVDVGGDDGALAGALMVIGAGLGYALGGFLLKSRLGDAEPLGVVTATMIASALLSLPAALASAPDGLPGAEATAAMLALGVGGTGIAFVIFYALIARVGPARALLVTYMAPAFAVLYGALLLDERVTAGTLAGLLLIVFGSWLAAGGGLRDPAPVAEAARRTA